MRERKRSPENNLAPEIPTRGMEVHFSEVRLQGEGPVPWLLQQDCPIFRWQRLPGKFYGLVVRRGSQMVLTGYSNGKMWCATTWRPPGYRNNIPRTAAFLYQSDSPLTGNFFERPPPLLACRDWLTGPPPEIPAGAWWLSPQPVSILHGKIVPQSDETRIRVDTSGSYGSVTFRGQVVSKQSNEPQYGADASLLREFVLLRKLQHPNIISTLDLLLVQGRIQLLLPNGGLDLRDWGRCSDMQIRQRHLPALTSQLLQAVGYLHSCKVYHGDLKPDNILVEMRNGHCQLRLVDFGLAVTEADLRNESPLPAMTAWYRAPEIVLSGQYGPEADVWAIGCILYEVEWQRPLFAISYEEHLITFISGFLSFPPELLRELTTKEKYEEFLPRLSTKGESPLDRRGLNPLIKRAVVVRPKDRASIAELLQESGRPPATLVGQLWSRRDWPVQNYRRRPCREATIKLLLSTAKAAKLTDRVLCLAIRMYDWYVSDYPVDVSRYVDCAIMALQLASQIVGGSNDLWVTDLPGSLRTGDSLEQLLQQKVRILHLTWERLYDWTEWDHLAVLLPTLSKERQKAARTLFVCLLQTRLNWFVAAELIPRLCLFLLGRRAGENPILPPELQDPFRCFQEEISTVLEQADLQLCDRGQSAADLLRSLQPNSSAVQSN